MMRGIRGRRIAVVLQAARAALTPTLRAETWIDRALALHDVPGPERAARLAHALEAVRLDRALLRRYPHQLSGGEAQRVSIALAVALRADLILADEATSALDVTVQAEVAELFRELRQHEGTSFLLVSHDLALVAGLADRISIIAEGRIVEQGGPEVLRHPSDPVTSALVAATPALPGRSCAAPADMTRPTPGRRGPRRARTSRCATRARIRARIRRCSWRLSASTPGDSLALVGESGSGKTTALRALLGLVTPMPARSRSVAHRSRLSRATHLRAFRRAVQLIPQDVDGALDPRQTIGSAIGEGWRAGDASVDGLADRVGRPHREDEVVGALLDEVGLPAMMARRHPHEVSGGQRQRAVIARALAVSPRLLLLDEPTSGLDSTVQARILELIERLRADRGLGILLISHNLGVVARLCPDHARPLSRRGRRGGPDRRSAGAPAPPLHGRPAPVGAGDRAALPDALAAQPGRCRVSIR